MSSSNSQASEIAGALTTFGARGLPPRVRRLLEGVHALMAAELQHGLLNALSEFENQLFQMAEQARSSSVQAQLMVQLREVRAAAGSIPEEFLRALESQLASVRDAKAAAPKIDLAPKLGELSLVEETEIDERILLQEIGGRAEVRNSLILFMLGQRFAVIAGKPAYDAESLPVGPTALCQMALRAISPMGWVTEYRHLFLRQFEKQVIQFCGTYYEALSNWLIAQGVLPNLRYMPMRHRGSAQPVETTAPRRIGGESETSPVAEPAPAALPQIPGTEQVAPEAPVARFSMVAGEQPRTEWPGSVSAPSVPDPAGAERFEDIRNLLAGRRSLVGKLSGKFGRSAEPSAPAPRASREDLGLVLDRLQRLQAAPVMQQGKPVARTVAHLKQDLLMQLRVGQVDGAAVELDEEDDDTIELVGMLLDHITKALNPTSAAGSLLTRLQVPLLRVALDDKDFFTKNDHPARQLLNSVAETSAWFSAEDPADKQVIDRMRLLVDRVVSEFKGDTSIFGGMLNDLSEHLQVQVRRAEMSEKRHVEAARGKEKLELARHQASEEVDAIIGTRAAPRFLTQLLQVAWADVLALSLLRHGADSDVHRHHVEIAERLVDAATGSGKALSDLAERAALTEDIEQGLGLVGYDAEEARNVAARLLAAASQDERDDPATRTELAVRLKQRARFGQDIAAVGSEKEAPLNEAEQAEFERIKRLPFGAWFEWKQESGGYLRKRMSWFSPITHHALFVNHRGQRVGEFTLDFLARELVAGRVRVLVEEKGSLVDRAWRSIVGALRSFGGRPEEVGA